MSPTCASKEVQQIEEYYDLPSSMKTACVFLHPIDEFQGLCHSLSELHVLILSSQTLKQLKNILL